MIIRNELRRTLKASSLNSRSVRRTCGKLEKNRKHVALLALLAPAMVGTASRSQGETEDVKMHIYTFLEGWLPSGKSERLFSKRRSLSEKSRSLFFRTVTCKGKTANSAYTCKRRCMKIHALSPHATLPQVQVVQVVQVVQHIFRYNYNDKMACPRGLP